VAPARTIGGFVLRAFLERRLLEPRSLTGGEGFGLSAL
jgi:hypothetical protein